MKFTKIEILIFKNNKDLLDSIPNLPEKEKKSLNKAVNMALKKVQKTAPGTEPKKLEILNNFLENFTIPETN